MLIQACFYFKIAENWVFKQSLQICTVEIMQNNTSRTRHSSKQKSNPTEMAPYKNGISKK